MDIGYGDTTFTSLEALKSAYPTGMTGRWVIDSDNEHDGYWFWWDSEINDWRDGGVFQGVGIPNNSIEPKKLHLLIKKKL